MENSFCSLLKKKKKWKKREKKKIKQEGESGRSSQDKNICLDSKEKQNIFVHRRFVSETLCWPSVSPVRLVDPRSLLALKRIAHNVLSGFHPINWIKQSVWNFSLKLWLWKMTACTDRRRTVQTPWGNRIGWTTKEATLWTIFSYSRKRDINLSDSKGLSQWNWY